MNPRPEVICSACEAARSGADGVYISRRIVLCRACAPAVATAIAAHLAGRTEVERSEVA